MHTPLRRPLTLALTAALAALLAVPAAQAQDAGSMRDQRAKRMAELGKGKDAGKAQEPAPLYPNATRTAPEARANPKLVKQLQELQQLFEEHKNEEAIAKAEAIAAMPAAGAYDKSYAYSVAGNAAADLDQPDRAAEFFRKAVDANGLDNNSHFAVMYNLVVLQYSGQKYADALATLDRFLAETKSDKPEHQSLRASILANLGRNDEALAIYKALLAKNPDDKRMLMNAVATLQAADKFDEANTLLEQGYKRGMLTEPRELRVLYTGYMNTQRWDDARRVMEEGQAKGILQPGPELARDYMVLAQNAYMDDKLPLAIELYGKAAPMAADGEAWLNQAKVLVMAGRKAEAKVAAQKALDKGVKKPEEAKRILATK